MRNTRGIFIVLTIFILVAVSAAIFSLYDKNDDITEFEIFTPIIGDITLEVIGNGFMTFNEFEDIGEEDLQFQMEVNEMDVPKIEENMDVIVSLNAFENKKYKGIVSEISDEGDVENDIATFKVLIDMVEKEEKSRAGMTGYASIILDKSENVICVPIEGIYNDGSDKYVLVQSGDNTEKVYVETGIYNDEYVEIKSGLTEENKIQIPLEEDSDYVNKFVPKVFKS